MIRGSVIKLHKPNKHKLQKNNSGFEYLIKMECYLKFHEYPFTCGGYQKRFFYEGCHLVVATGYIK